jgi:hypothetical protein
MSTGAFVAATGNNLVLVGDLTLLETLLQGLVHAKILKVFGVQRAAMNWRASGIKSPPAKS